MGQHHEICRALSDCVAHARDRETSHVTQWRKSAPFYLCLLIVYSIFTQVSLTSRCRSAASRDDPLSQFHGVCLCVCHRRFSLCVPTFPGFFSLLCSL